MVRNRFLAGSPSSRIIFAKAVAAQQSGFLAGEIVPVVTEKFELDGYKPRGIKLQGKITEVTQDTHPRISPADVLANLRPVYEGGVQTGGNSSALVDAAAACVVPGARLRPRRCGGGCGVVGDV